jgi:hypothetical protein
VVLESLNLRGSLLAFAVSEQDVVVDVGVERRVEVLPRGGLRLPAPAYVSRGRPRPTDRLKYKPCQSAKGFQPWSVRRPNKNHLTALLTSALASFNAALTLAHSHSNGKRPEGMLVVIDGDGEKRRARARR